MTLIVHWLHFRPAWVVRAFFMYEYSTMVANTSDQFILRTGATWGMYISGLIVEWTNARSFFTDAGKIVRTFYPGFRGRSEICYPGSFRGQIDRTFSFKGKIGRTLSFKGKIGRTVVLNGNRLDSSFKRKVGRTLVFKGEIGQAFVLNGKSVGHKFWRENRLEISFKRTVGRTRIF